MHRLRALRGDVPRRGARSMDGRAAGGSACDRRQKTEVRSQITAHVAGFCLRRRTEIQERVHMPKVLITGNEALAEAAVRAGCKRYFGYPITPQNEIPAVIVNMQRGGPGLGNIAPSQADYFQAVKGGGHGDYKLLVYAPSGIQEIVDLTVRAFEKADEYRTPVMILGDGVLGQMMEPVELSMITSKQMEKPWALTGARGRPGKVIRSLFMLPGEDGMLERHNYKLKAKYDRMAEREVMCETIRTEDAEIAVVAFGTSARIAKTAVSLAREEGVKVGLIRPITLFPFPEKIIAKAAESVKRFLVVSL